VTILVSVVTILVSVVTILVSVLNNFGVLTVTTTCGGHPVGLTAALQPFVLALKPV
jgi:hypothetical protein